MQEVFEKIIEKVSNLGWVFADYYPDGTNISRVSKKSVPYDEVVEIVKQEEEQYNNGWISCDVRLPEEAFGCLVTVMDCEPSTQTEFENILPYFVGYDGDSWNDADGEEIPFEVIAWKPLPEPYQPKGE